MIRRVWTIADVLVLVATVLLVLAFFAVRGWLGITDWASWLTAGLAVFVASFLWRA